MEMLTIILYTAIVAVALGVLGYLLYRVVLRIVDHENEKHPGK